MKTRKRFVSLLLAVCLVAGLMPTAVFATGADTGKAIQLVDGGTAANISGGQADNIYFGTYQQSSDGNGGYNVDPIKWRVLENAEGKLFLLSDKNLDAQPYHSDWEIISWERSTIRSWLNGYEATSNDGGDDGTDYTSNNFIENAFSDDEQEAIDDTYVYNATQSNESTAPNPDHSDASGGNNTTDKIFLLSIEEVTNTTYGFISDGNASGDSSGRVALNTERCYYAWGSNGENDWWLRTVGNDRNDAAYVEYTGEIDSFGISVDYSYSGIRPAFNLNLNSVLFTSAAAGGKSLGTMGTLSTVSDYTGNEWKMTLLDSSRSLTANVNGQASASVSAGGSVQISYTGARTGDNEYVSVLLCDSNDTVLHYGNIAQNSASGAATLNIPSGLTVGNYTLKVFSEQCNGDYKTDYASAFQNISLTILPQEATPQASFTAKSDNGGTLSNVDTSMKYSTDGGVNWNAVTGTSMELTGVTAANDVLVKRPGNGSTTSDSAVQTIDITQATKPTVSGADCTTSEQNDGKITGVDSTMEYKLSTASEWTDITGTETTGLSNGTYDVRVKANGTVLASAAATVTIGAHTCVAQGEWQYNANEHWKLCTCGAEVDRAAHSGGTATCKAFAVCEVCGQSYGKKDMNNHTGTVVWVQASTTHKQVYNCCQTEVSAEENHNWADGKCTVCNYPCAHTGGTATCSQLAVCDICGSSYGDYDADNHKAVSAWTQENGKHYHKCEYGCNTHLDEADCSGGEATCTSLAVCETCGNAYGAVNPDNHTGEIVWTKTATDHSSAYDCCGATVVAKEAHEWENGVCSECGYECQHDGGTATCADKAVCDTCGEEYGEVNASNHTNLVKTEAKPATHMTEGNIEYWYCDGCDKYFSDEAGTEEIALANTVIPKLTGHTADGTGWHSDEISHWNTCECGEKLNEAAHTFEWVIDKEATAAEKGSKHEKCTVCGYEKAAVEIPATGTPSDTDTSSPQTGDDSNIALWIAVMLAAGAALTGTAVYSRKRKYSR